MLSCETCQTSYRACNNCSFKYKTGVSYASRIIIKELIERFDRVLKELAKK